MHFPSTPLSEQSAWPAPAKINLFLHVCGRRADGYHELQTLFQFLDFGDELEFQPREDGAIRLTGGLTGVAHEDDLVVRAARLLQRASRTPQGADIQLRKRIPAGAGLGGGSSDAATTLAVLNRLWNVNLAAAELAKLGLQLGADVPIFLHGHAAWAEGVGEKLSDVDLADQWILLIMPEVSVSTAAVFTDPDLPRATPRIQADQYRFASTRNDCEPLVRRLYPVVDQALTSLSKFAPARMSGTGAAAFACFPDRASAQAAFAQLQGRWPMRIARGCAVSPLTLALRQLP